MFVTDVPLNYQTKRKLLKNITFQINYLAIFAASMCNIPNRDIAKTYITYYSIWVVQLLVATIRSFIHIMHIISLLASFTKLSI